MNSAAVKRPDLVSQAAKAYGAVRVTIAIDGKKNMAMPSSSAKS